MSFFADWLNHDQMFDHPSHKNDKRLQKPHKHHSRQYPQFDRHIPHAQNSLQYVDHADTRYPVNRRRNYDRINKYPGLPIQHSNRPIDGLCQPCQPCQPCVIPKIRVPECPACPISPNCPACPSVSLFQCQINDDDYPNQRQKVYRPRKHFNPNVYPRINKNK